MLIVDVGLHIAKSKCKRRKDEREVKKLGILITHYNEPFKECKFMFDTISTQRGIDFDDLEVIVVNDGNENPITEDMLSEYPFKTQICTIEHGGVSKARNYALMQSKADYTLFCDCDDGWLNNYSMHTIFSAMNENYDVIVGTFIEEQKAELPNGEMGWRIISHDKDMTFIHGKVFKRDFLIENDLKFDENLTIHEDGYFVCLALTTAENKKYISFPIYLWKWNENSTVRKDSTDYVLKTYDNLMDCRISLMAQLRDRGFISEFMDGVAKTVFDSYYDMQKPNALDPKNVVLVRKAEKAFKRFYEEYKDVYHECAVKRIAEIAFVSRANAFQNGLRIEQQTIREWLNHITKEVK